MTVGKPPKDPPLVPPASTPFGAGVIDLASIRIQRGVTDARVARECEHKSLTYSHRERRVWCDDCERTIDGFDAFMTIVKYFDQMVSAAKSKVAKADEGLKATITRRATKQIDRAWSGRQMAISCPHCRAGLLPEDFESGFSTVSAEIERARRAKKREAAQ